MSFSHWLNNLKNRIQPPARKRKRRHNARPNSASLQTALNSATESLEDRILLTTDVTLATGVLVIADVDGANTNDQLEISYAGGTYTITDTGGAILNTAIAGATGDGTSTVTVPDTGVTSVVFDTLSGDDTVTVNSLQASLPAGFAINNGAGTDIANFAGALDIGNGLIAVTAETINIDADLSTGTADQTFNGAVVQGATVTLNAGSVTFNGTLDSDAADTNNLTVNTSGGGATEFNGAVGGANRLNFLTTNADGVTRINTSTFATFNDQRFNDAVVLETDTTLTTIGGAAEIVFFSTLNSDGTPRNLIANSPSTTSIRGVIGNVSPLASLTTDAGGTTNISGGVVTTTGGQTYNDSVSILSINTTLLSNSGGTVAFASTLGTGANDTSIVADEIDFGGNVSGTGSLTLAPNSASATIGVGGGAGTLDLSNADLAFLQDGFSSITIGDTAAGSGAVDIQPATFNDPVTIAGGDVAVNGALANAVDSGISLQANGTLTVSSSIATTGSGAFSGTATRNILLNSGSSITTVNGGITLDANSADSGTGAFNGISVLGATITTATGTVSLTGRGGSGSGGDFGVALETGARISSTAAAGAGDITLTGVGGSDGANRGVSVTFSSVIETVSADIFLDGTASDIGTLVGLGATVRSTGSATINLTGDSAASDDVAVADGLIDSGTSDLLIDANTVRLNTGSPPTRGLRGSGNLVIKPRTAATTIGLGGGSGTLNLTDSELALLDDGFSSITIGDGTSGDIDVDTATVTDPLTLITNGEIHDNAGTDINAGMNTVTADGTIAPGQSPGILTVTGNFAFADNSTLEIEIGGTSPGETATDHDQVDVTGSVTIGSNVALSTSSFGGFTVTSGDSFVIINNDGADAISGMFAGLPEGALISDFVGDGVDAAITYVGGDGNDIELIPTTTFVSVSGGNLDLTSTGDADDSLTIEIDGANYRISRVGGGLTAVAGATPDGNDLLVPVASVTGVINVTTSDGDDDLEVDYNGGIITSIINYDGGGQTSGDSLTFTAATATSVTHSFTNANDGSVDVVIGGMTSTINYTGLEPINDNLNVADRVFEFTGSDEQIMLTDDGDIGDGQSFIDSDLGESVTFNNPTGSLTIDVGTNGGSGMDLIDVSGLDSMFDADLTINGENDDLVTFIFDPTDVGTGNVFATGVAVGVVFGGSIATNGGSLTFETTEEIFIAGDVSSGGGDIIFNADTDQAVTPDGSVVIEDAMVTSGGGRIVIGGGADPTMTPTIGTAAAPHPDGVYIHNSILNSGIGDISILGSAANDEDGVDIGGASTLITTTGQITIDGTGTGLDDGVDLHGASSISTTTGDISISGTASGGAAEDGVLISGNGVGMETTVSTQAGSITITGTGANDDSGVEFSGFVIVESTGASGAGAITIDGTSDTPDRTDSEAGTSILESIVRSVSGAIDIAGTSATFDGLAFDFGSSVQSSGTGAGAATITLTGNGGEFALVVADATVSSVDGNIMLDGTAGTDEGTLLFGGVVESTGTTTDAATITIDGTSTGGDGVAIVDSGGTGSQVNSVAGAISITGDATGGAGDGVFLDDSSRINSTGTGPTAAGITIDGTSGTSQGVELVGVINTVDGAISITGDATNGTEGVFVDNAIAATGTGAVSITGTGNPASGTPTGIFFDGTVNTDSGMITAQALVGRIAIDSDEFLSSESGDISVSTTDTAATGDDIELIGVGAISSVSGRITLTSGDDVIQPSMASIITNGNTIDITVDAGDADPNVGGNADLMGIVFGDSLIGTGGPDNDLIRLPSGMFGFNGVATLTGNGGDDTLVGGDQNDSISGGAGADSLDGGGGSDTLSSGAGNDMINGSAGADLFQWSPGDGSDTFDGGADADSITIGTGTVTSVTHNFVNNSDGSFGVDAETVTYTNIEPIIDQLTATTRTFTFTGGAETISLTDDGDAGDGQSMIDSNLGEVVTFNNPSSTLTINAGSGSDTVNLTSLDSTFDADLLVQGDGTAMAGSASVNVNGNVDTGSGGVTIGTGGNVTQVSLNGGSLTTTGNVSLQTTDAIVDGDANVDVTASGLLLSAGESIGSTADPLETAIANLEVATTRGLTVTETDDLTIGGVDGGTTGVTATSTIAITAAGLITVDEDVTTDAGNGGDLTITGSVSVSATATVSALDDDVSLTGNDDGDDDISIDGTISADINIDLSATQDILVNGQVSTVASIGEIEFRADSERNSAGGVVIGVSGEIAAAGSFVSRGSSTVAAGDGNGLALFVADDGANTQVSAAGGIRLVGNFVAPGESITVNGITTMTTTNSGLTIQANDSINIGPNAVLTAQSRFFSFIADAGSVTLADGSVLSGGDSFVSIDAGQDVSVSSISTTSGVGILAGGAITDSGTTAVNVSASSLAVRAGTGVATLANPLETQVGRLAAETATGDIVISNTGSLEIAETGIDDGGGTINGVSITGGGGTGEITVTTTGALTLSAAVTNASAGDVTLTAVDAASAGQNLAIGAVAVSATTGAVTFNVGDNLTDDMNSNVSTAGNIVINIDDGDQDAGTGATAILQGTITAGSLTINGQGDDDQVDLSGLQNDPAATLNGNAGNDTLTGADGGDLIVGGTGDDTMSGGGGDDTVTAAGGGGTDSVDAGAGSDVLRVTDPASGGSGMITFNGGADSDLIELNGNPVDSVTHSFISNSDGSINSVSGTTTHDIVYTGLEPINDNLSATDRIFEFTSANDETITITDDATAGNDVTTIDSTEGEIVSFVSPTNSMTVDVNANGGSGADTINVQGVDSMFDADLTINGGDNDPVAFQTNATDVGTGNVTARGSAITVLSPVTTAGGNLSFEATTDVFGLAQISSGGGNIIFNADTDQATAPGGSVVIDNSAMVSSSGGNIVIGGGADPLTTPAIAQAAGVMVGVNVRGAVLDAGTGNISIRGASDISGNAVELDSSAITSTIGSITIIGESTGSMGIATVIRPDTTISTTTGNISVTGNSSGMAMSGISASANTNAGIMTQTGAIDIVGTAGTGNNGFTTGNGVEISGPFVISSSGAAPAGGITITGTASTAGGPFGGGRGVFMNIGATVTSASAPIIINGTNPADSGVVVGAMSAVQSTGTGATAANITITGNGGPGGFGNGDGIRTEGLISSVDGDIQLTGSAPGGDNCVEVGASIQATGDGNVTLTSPDTVAAGEDIAIGAVTVSSTTGNVTLNSGDTVIIDAGATVSAGMLLQINVDAGNADPGVGETLTLQGTLSGGSGITATGDSDDDQLDASAISAAITLQGNGGNDTLIGGSGNDLLEGAAGDDMLTGGAGDDTIDGGSGNELIVWNNGDGSDVIDGGADTDELEVNGSTVSPAGDMITVSANGARFDLTRADGGAGLGPFSLDVGTIETLDLNTLDGDDDVTVNDLTGVSDLAILQIDAGAGNDTVDASALPDLGLTILLEGGDDNDTLTGAAGSSMINGNMGNDTLIGGAAADTIMGGGGDDVMNGGAGGDMLSGQAGDDTMTGDLGDDTMNGGANTDRIVESRDADFDLGDATLTISPAETDSLVDVEEADLNGGASANTIDASDFSGTATLMGGDNDDTITGAMGASVVNGNMGNDSLTGLDADDTLMGGGNDDILNGGAGGDMLTGQAGDDTMTGGLGDDTLNGGADTDQIIESGDTDFDLGDTSLVSPLFGTDVLTDVEEAMLTGGASANTIDASDFSGVTTLMGGDSDDTITGAMGASAINGNMGNDDLTGLGAADTIMGGGGDDVMDGGAGGDMLTGQAGDDTMTGGLGDDTLNGGADTDQIIESGDTDFDLGDTSLVSPLNGTDVLIDVEEADLTGGASANTIDASDFTGVATLMGGSGNDTITGAMGASVINGNADDDSLTGLGSSDTIMGGGGNDNIDGGAGNDTLTGQANDDTIIGNTGDDNIMGGDGADLINGSLGNDTISGDAGDDRIQGSNQTDYPGTPLSPIPDLNTLGLTDQDSLLGGAGSDTIAGAIGADFIDGEADADIIDAQSGGDTTNGIDTIVGDIADFIFKDPEDNVL